MLFDDFQISHMAVNDVSELKKKTLTKILFLKKN